MKLNNVNYYVFYQFSTLNIFVGRKNWKIIKFSAINKLPDESS